MSTHKFVVLLVVAVVLGSLVGYLEHRTVAGALEMALKTILIIPVAFVIVRWDGFRAG